MNEKAIKNAGVFPDQNEDGYVRFCRMAHEGLGATLAQQWIKNIWDEQVEEDEISEQEAFEQLKQVIHKRGAVKRKPTKIENQAEDSLTERERELVVSDIVLSQSMPDLFLGNGSVANVYVMASAQQACVKIVHSNERYQEGNSIWQEAKFLEALKDFEVAGVRSPHLKNMVYHVNTTAIIMERLNAVNCSRVVEEKDELPERFDVDDFFDRLKVYLRALHEKGIYHNDFYLRNIMIDVVSGLPYVIDFGKAVFRNDILGERFHMEEEIFIRRDLAGLENAKARMKQWIALHKMSANA